MEGDHAEVGTDAGAPRPAWVLRQGVRRRVSVIEAEGVESGRRLYRVRLDSDEVLLLVYRREDARWSVTPAVPPFAPPPA